MQQGRGAGKRRRCRAGSVLAACSIAGAAPLAVASASAPPGPSPHPDAVTVYTGRISAHPTWQGLLTEPWNPRLTDSWLVTAARSRQFATSLDQRLAWELEGQVTYHFGEQSHWEFNLPVIARWQRFPWSERLRTTAAFGLGLSWATEVPETEVRLEGTSARWLVYWVMELTVGPPDARWDISTRIHHRSKAFGLFAEAGGMNAATLGLRYRF
jgi:hypothetical protein